MLKEINVECRQLNFHYRYPYQGIPNNWFLLENNAFLNKKPGENLYWWATDGNCCLTCNYIRDRNDYMLELMGIKIWGEIRILK
jgi:hypothetical protein